MDFKPEKYKKGEMVRFFRRPQETLGIVKGHDGGKVEVEWVLWPSQVKPHHGWYPMYKVQRVTQDSARFFAPYFFSPRGLIT